jgi:hypothetical protein
METSSTSGLMSEKIRGNRQNPTPGLVFGCHRGSGRMKFKNINPI